jgi:hypothetical protein
MRRTEQLSLLGALGRSLLCCATILGASGCGSSTPACVKTPSLDCSPLFAPPTYQAIFTQILEPNCATGMGTCHTPDGAKNGLVFADADAAYQLLLSPPNTSPRVLPGDPGCSLIMIRLESTDPNYRMPPGPTPLDPAARCAIAQWIAQGAPR